MSTICCTRNIVVSIGVAEWRSRLSVWKCSEVFARVDGCGFNPGSGRQKFTNAKILSEITRPGQNGLKLMVKTNVAGKCQKVVAVSCRLRCGWRVSRVPCLLLYYIIDIIPLSATEIPCMKLCYRKFDIIIIILKCIIYARHLWNEN